MYFLSYIYGPSTILYSAMNSLQLFTQLQLRQIRMPRGLDLRLSSGYSLIAPPDFAVWHPQPSSSCSGCEARASSDSRNAYRDLCEMQAICPLDDLRTDASESKL